MAIGLVDCNVCGLEFTGSVNAMYCSNRCKQASYRASNKTTGFIYHLKNKGDIVYVGQSKSEQGVTNRVITHTSSRSKKVFDEYESHMVTGVNLNEEEAREIIKHSPIHNKRLPSNKTYITVKQLSENVCELMEEVVTKYCDTYFLGDREYVKSSEIENLKKAITSRLLNKQAKPKGGE